MNTKREDINNTFSFFVNFLGQENMFILYIVLEIVMYDRIFI